jgi:hypothetical protein
MPYAPASLALVEGLVALTDLVVDLSALRDNASNGQRKVNELIAQSEEHQEMVRQLEEQYAEEVEGERQPGRNGRIEESELPTGDELIEELERYLRGEGEQ